MEIKVVKSIGVGSTLLSSFDSALQNAGVSNYNLIRLSSIIPPHAKVTKIPRFQTPPSEFGYKLYNVMAEMRSNQAGKYMAAGIGWYQLGERGGLFVEHEVIGETKTAVMSEINQLIHNSLKDLCLFRKIDFDESNIESTLSIAKIKSTPTCVLVMAVYQSEGWM